VINLRVIETPGLINFASMKLKIASILLIFFILNASEAVFGQDHNKKTGTSEASPSLLEEYMKGYYSQVFGVDITEILNPALYETIENWLGTPYRYAGNTLQGIDCSGFVNKIYENVYCAFLSGNSATLFKQVKHLPKDKLREGDLVFFRINRRNISHVGVYLGNNRFVHASQSSGVIISSLDSPYYKKYFVKGGRVNFSEN
jgi:murein DD-endopeptidase / murein LD-carboxypeptidase